MDILDTFFKSEKLKESNIEILPNAGVCKDENGSTHPIDFDGVGFDGVGQFYYWLFDRADHGIDDPIPAALTITEEDGTESTQHSYWKLEDFKKYLDAVNERGASVTHVRISESKMKENVGDLPAGYTDEDLAEFLDKEPSIPTEIEEDVYDPSDEVIQFVFNDPNSDIQKKIDEKFDGGYVDNSSMATIGEFRNFVMENELDVEDFRIYDTKGEEYFDKLALVYDTVRDPQGLEENIKEISKKEKLNEAVIAGANGLVYSSENRSAKHDAADALLRKIGKLKEPAPLNESIETHSPDDNNEDEVNEFYNMFYDDLVDHPDGDPYWDEVATAEDGKRFLEEFKKIHPDTTITEEDAVRYYENFLGDRADN